MEEEGCSEGHIAVNTFLIHAFSASDQKLTICVSFGLFVILAFPFSFHSILSAVQFYLVSLFKCIQENF